MTLYTLNGVEYPICSAEVGLTSGELHRMLESAGRTLESRKAAERAWLLYIKRHGGFSSRSRRVEIVVVIVFLVALAVGLVFGFWLGSM